MKIVLLAALLAIAAVNVAKVDGKQVHKDAIQHYDWKQWLSKRGKSSVKPTSDAASSSGKKGKGFDWQQFISNSYGQIPSGLEEKYSFSPFNWEKFLSFNGQEKELQFYDWKQWLSKRGKSSVTKKPTSDAASSSGKKGKGFDWKNFISNSYDQIPSGLEEKYSFSPFNWEKFLSFNGHDKELQFYDWQQWFSKSASKEGKDGYDWEKWLSNSYIPRDIQFYDWRKWLSKSSSKGTSGVKISANKRLSQSTSFGKKKRSSRKSASGGGSGKYNWKQWLSKSSGGKGSSSDVSRSKVRSSRPSGSYDWRKWLSKSASGSGKKGGHDWKKWLSKSSAKVSGSGFQNSQVSTSAGLSRSSGKGGYDWKKWLSKSVNSGSGSGKGGGYDWKKWISRSDSIVSGSGIGSSEVPELSGSSGTVSGSGKGGYDWKQWLSRSSGSGTGGHDWKQWLSRSGSGISVNEVSDLVSDTSIQISTSTGSNGGYDWKQWLSNSFGKPPSGLEEQYSFSPFDWNKFLSTDKA